MGAGVSAGPLVRRGDSAVQEHAYGVEKASLPVGPAPFVSQRRFALSVH
jgi:hypothetical protein